MYVWIRVYIYIYVCIHIHTYKYTYIYNLVSICSMLHSFISIIFVHFNNHALCARTLHLKHAQKHKKWLVYDPVKDDVVFASRTA
jgi:hypothetical protein